MPTEGGKSSRKHFPERSGAVGAVGQRFIILPENRILGSVDKGAVFIVFLSGDSFVLHTAFQQNVLRSCISGKDFRLDAV